MRSFHVPGHDPRRSAGFSPRERRKLVLLALGLLLVVAILVVGSQKARFSDRRPDDLPAEVPGAEDGESQARVLLPEIDQAQLDELVRDDESLERVVLESEALDLLLEDVRVLTPRHFDALEPSELDGEQVEEIVADPGRFRGEAFTARGEVDALRTRRRGADEEHIGRLLLEDGSAVYFLVLDAPADPSYLRVDGLFLKVFNDEDEMRPGEWIEGPLLVGPRAVRSERPFGEVTERDWELLLEELEDADLAPAADEEPRIVSETPARPLWHMMAFACDLAPDAVDWEEARLLDDEMLTRLVDEPERWRGQALRIPISRLQDARVIRAGENPARIERYTTGWIGNTTWSNVIHFMLPRAAPELRLRDHVRGRGFFLHTFSYQSAQKGLRVAPVVVLSEIERIEPRVAPIFRQLGYGVAATSILLIVLFFALLARDRRRSLTLQRELVRRRRERRARGSVEPSSS